MMFQQYATVKTRIMLRDQSKKIKMESSVHLTDKILARMDFARQDKYARGRLKTIHFYSHFRFIKNICYAPALLGKVSWKRFIKVNN